MEIRKVGALRTLGLWENLLASLPTHAEGLEGLGRMWENEDPPRQKGQDSIIKQGWRLNVIRGVQFETTNGAEVIQVDAEHSATGKAYTLVRMDRTAVHLHGVEIVDGKVVGDIHVCARVFWPKGSDQRQDYADSKAWRNYLLFLDVYPPQKENIEYELVVFPEGSDRTPLISLGREATLGDTPAIAWSTRSANWKPARDRQPSTGSDQLVAFIKRT